MFCPFCANEKTKVIATVKTSARIDRLRFCKNCKRAFATKEQSTQNTLNLYSDKGNGLCPVCFSRTICNTTQGNKRWRSCTKCEWANWTYEVVIENSDILKEFKKVFGDCYDGRSPSGDDKK